MNNDGIKVNEDKIEVGEIKTLPVLEETKSNIGNPLGKKVIDELLKSKSNKQIILTEDAYNRSVCTHLYDGVSMLEESSSGKVKCKICDAEFRPINLSQQQVDDISSQMVDMMQSIKTKWIGIPDKTVIQFFQAIAIIEKIPELNKAAQLSYDKYMKDLQDEEDSFTTIQGYNNSFNGYAMYNPQQYVTPSCNSSELLSIGKERKKIKRVRI